MRQKSAAFHRSQRWFLARAGCALILLGVLTAAYLLDLVIVGATGHAVSPGTHRAFSGMIVLSAILTAATLAWDKLKQR